MKLVNIHKHILILGITLFFAHNSFPQNWSLQQCIDSAESHNKNLQIAKNNITLSGQKEKEAKANLLPKLSANTDYKYFTNLPYQLMPLSTFNPSAQEGEFKEAQFGVPHNINANLQLAIPLYNPQIYGGIEATKIASEISVIQYDKNKEQISFDITNLYYNAQILQAQLTFLNSNLANAERLYTNLKLLQEQLLATGTDVEKVQLLIAQLNTQKSTVTSKLTQVLNTLKFIIGIPNEQDFDIEYTISQSQEIEYSYHNTLDARLIQSQKKLLQSEFRTLNNSRYYPTVNLIGSYGTTGFGYNKSPNSFLNFYTIGFAGLQVTYPIYNGSVNLRKIDQKQIELSNYEIKFQLIQDQNTMQITNATLQRTTTYLVIETSKQQIQLAQNIYNNSILQQKQGIVTLTEVLLADNALREAQQTNLSAIIEYLKADLELKKWTGNIK